MKAAKLIEILFGIIIPFFFIAAGISKIYSPQSFYESILNYQLLPEKTAWQAALFMPWLEVFAGAAYFLKYTRRASLVWMFTMMLGFQMALFSALFRGLNIDCGCLGTTISTSVEIALIRNFVIIAALAFLALRMRIKNRLSA